MGSLLRKRFHGQPQPFEPWNTGTVILRRFAYQARHLLAIPTSSTITPTFRDTSTDHASRTSPRRRKVFKMDPSKVSIFKTYDKPRGEGGSNSFATFMIIGPVCFFLGMLFSSFPYDYPLLWTTEATPAAYYDQLEIHLRFLHASPPIIARILHIAITVGFVGFFIKLFKPSEANLLFDGASLVLYLIAARVGACLRACRRVAACVLACVPA